MASTRSTGLLLAGNGASLFGDGMFVVAIGFAVLAVGGGPGALGIVLLAGVGTMLFGILPAGVFADRRSPRLIVVAADIVRGCTQLVVAAIVATPGAHWWHLVGCSIVFGLASTLQMPASTALTAQVVHRDSLERVNGALQALRGLGIVVGGAAAGMIVARAGTVPVIVVDALTFFACALCVLAIRDIPARPVAAQAADGDAVRATRVQDLRASIRVVREHRWLAHGLLLTAGFVVVSYAPIQVVGPAAARGAAGAAGVAGPELWAWMSAATALGMIIGGVTAMVRPPASLMAIVRVLLLTGGLGPIAFALDVNPIWTLPGFAALGGAMGLFTAGWESAKQARVDHGMLARIGALDWFTQISSMIPGVAVAALVSATVGTDTVLLGMGVGCAVVALLSLGSEPLGAIFRDRVAERGTASPGIEPAAAAPATPA